MSTTNQEGCLGARLGGAELQKVLEQLFDTNLILEEKTGRRPTPICIWGTHGMGKTQIAMDIAKSKKWKIAYCAPAQFEEMGDLHGLPFKIDPDPTKIGDERTAYMPPDWVPTDEGPGILLLDDMNRADDRILRGTMQLLQNFEMFSWSLPPKWQIIATANPDSGDYSVTPMDEAMLTRMLHLTLNFDVKSWAEWAIKNGVDSRGIDFILTYPEVVTFRRTTPRSLVQFFGQIHTIPDLVASIDLVAIIASSCLDEETVSSFITFIQSALTKIPNPLTILNADKPEDFISIVNELAIGEGGSKRIDLLNTLFTRMLIELKSSEYIPNKELASNLIAFLLMDVIPGDLRFALHRDLSGIGSSNLPSSKGVLEACKNPKVGEAILKMI